MRNPKSKSIRKIRPASTSAILSAPARRASRTCHNSHPPHPFPSATPLTNDYQLSSINHQLGRRSRNGKIARLPCEARDMVNRMLRNNIPHSQIVGALDELQFKVTERNISNWKTRGGYRDWCIAQDRALETRLLQDNLLAHLRTSDASQLAEIGLQMAATELSQFFLKPETRQQLNREPEKLARTIGILCRLARQIHILQKHRDQSAKELGAEHHPEHVKRETDQTIETVRDIYSANKPCESADDPIISHHNFLPKNGFRPDPLPETPEEEEGDSHIEHNIKLFEAALAARNAQYDSQPSHQTSAQGSAACAATGDSLPEPALSHDSPASHDAPATTEPALAQPQTQPVPDPCLKIT